MEFNAAQHPVHTGHIDSDAFCHGLKDLFDTMSTLVGFRALMNKMPDVVGLLLKTNAITYTVDASMTPVELKLDIIRLCFTVSVSHFVETYPHIMQLLQTEIDRIHHDKLAEYCYIYYKDINTVTATELAREMIRGIDVTYRDATGHNAKHFGVAFLHLGMIHRGSNLEHVIKKDLQKFSDHYTASDLFKYLIANGRS